MAQRVGVPGIICPDQRIVQSPCPYDQYHATPDPSLVAEAVEPYPFDGLQTPDDLQQLEDLRQILGQQPLERESWSSDLDTVSSAENSASTVDVDAVPAAFSQNFFINPFDVSFPGDIPCATSVSMVEAAGPQTSSSTSTSHTSHTSPKLVSTTSSPTFPPTVQCRTSPFMVDSQPSSTLDRPVPKQSPRQAPNLGRQIHFVDMADKKGAQRLRNTINSRKHRQNKLDRIRELEEKLAACEADRRKWKERAEELGWTENRGRG